MPLSPLKEPLTGHPLLQSIDALSMVDNNIITGDGINSVTLSKFDRALSPSTPVVSFQNPGDLSVTYTQQSADYYYRGSVVTILYNLSFTPIYTTSNGYLTISLPVTIGGIGNAARNGLIYHGANLSYPAGTVTLMARALTSSLLFIRAVGPSTFDRIDTTNMPSGLGQLIAFSISFDTP